MPGITGGGEKGRAFSTISVMNTSEISGTKISFAFRDTDIHGTEFLPPLGSMEISTADYTNISNECIVEINSEDTSVAVVSHYIDITNEQGAAYSGLAVGKGGTKLYAPEIVWSKKYTTNTTIYIQNLSKEDVKPVLLLYEGIANNQDNFNLPSSLFTIPLGTLESYQTVAFDVGRYLGSQIIADKWNGSAVIEGSAELGAVILTRSNGTEERWATAYNAIPKITE